MGIFKYWIHQPVTMSDDNILEPKKHRSFHEIGRLVRKLVQEHETIHVSKGEHEWDIKITVDDE